MAQRTKSLIQKLCVKFTICIFRCRSRMAVVFVYTLIHINMCSEAVLPPIALWLVHNRKVLKACQSAYIVRDFEITHILKSFFMRIYTSLFPKHLRRFLMTAHSWINILKIHQYLLVYLIKILNYSLKIVDIICDFHLEW